MESEKWMSERDMAAYQLVGILSWIYDSHPEALPESMLPRVRELMKVAMPSWKPINSGE
jgi:hypothetical protein